MRRLLLVAFHYPPLQASSGVHRALAFSRYLPEFGWDVTVLTTHARAYQATLAANENLIPPRTTVVRAQAWDAARHFSVLGRFPKFLALPDRWQSWIPGGTLAGLRAIRDIGADAILTTFPVASAHLIGLLIHKRTGLPWIADFRDPMAQPAYPKDALIRRSYHWIESKVMKYASRVTVTTKSTAAHYRDTYPTFGPQNVQLLENGFDPASFAGAEVRNFRAPPLTRGRLVLLHSGIVYPQDRDPVPFLKAVANLINDDTLPRSGLEIRFRASGHAEQFAAVVESLNLSDVVNFQPPISYDEALKEMAEADALLLLQARSVNRQIPAKLYEYLYVGRPIIGITDPEGDTGMVLRDMGIPGVAALEDSAGIESMLRRSLEQFWTGQYPVPSRDRVMQHSRRERTAQLAALLEDVMFEAGRARS
jgi:glycosyltransferase involved in cell wall biosynthesis